MREQEAWFSKDNLKVFLYQNVSLLPEVGFIVNFVRRLDLTVCLLFVKIQIFVFLIHFFTMNYGEMNSPFAY